MYGKFDYTLLSGVDPDKAFAYAPPPEINSDNLPEVSRAVVLESLASKSEISISAIDQHCDYTYKHHHELFKALTLKESG